MRAFIDEHTLDAKIQSVQDVAHSGDFVQSALDKIIHLQKAIKMRFGSQSKQYCKMQIQQD